MNNNARERIFARLRTAVAKGDFNIPDAPPLTWPSANAAERVASLKQKLEAMKAEVYVTPSGEWVEKLRAVLKGRNLNRMLFAPDTAVGQALKSGWGDANGGLPELFTFDGTVEAYREELFFKVDAAVTTAKAGIADTGALVLWPDEKEPRLSSLVPPVHIAVLSAADIYSTFTEAVEQGKWADGMPTNALLISGPSKTADIELVLVFGVHGPSDLIVMITE
ncbi:lactate utilization protein [Desulfonema ishimotonii]|uniref:Lactate utilization protein n=1 Tax=Desulfonema ishimotonii TaxID=45657 RepID=A0A401FW01_9BACT|nr:lactate utilization protein [Desulfonema ishimotonii]GBC61146.1 lactate utilization protein [Desulfonema ishimotonii]